jgi:hypothetical protein
MGKRIKYVKEAKEASTMPIKYRFKKRGGRVWPEIMAGGLFAQIISIIALTAALYVIWAILDVRG